MRERASLFPEQFSPARTSAAGLFCVPSMFDSLEVQHWPAIREQLIAGKYKPSAVKRVTIPKPDGGERKLGIPTTLDRLIQQAILQVLQPIWDSTFSYRSYGFRPGRSAHQAVAKAQEYIGRGKAVVVDMDVETFFSRSTTTF
jgi:RNA-directed DNA polymerase